MPFITGFLTFWSKGGWKIFLAIGVAGGLFFGVKYVTDEIGRSAARQEQIIQLQGQLDQRLTQSINDSNRIKQQNDQILEATNRMRINTASIGEIRRQLSELGSTITPDVDPSVFDSDLQTIINNQYACLERVTRGETNATCA